MNPTKLIPGDISNVPNPRHADMRVDPTLLTLINEGVRRFKIKNPTYVVEVYGPSSGLREKGHHTSNHGKKADGNGRALDVIIKDTQTKKSFPNYQDGAYANVYQELANFVKMAQEKYYPTEGLRFGGYFSGHRGTYGALDLMHFDFLFNKPMGGGSWNDGYTAQQFAYWKIPSNVGMKEFRKQQPY
jgi:hypothetical protein